MTFVGGYTYRFKYANGTHADYVFAGTNGNTTIWKKNDGTVRDGIVFENVIEIHELSRPGLASNERQ